MNKRVLIFILVILLVLSSFSVAAYSFTRSSLPSISVVDDAASYSKLNIDSDSFSLKSQQFDKSKLNIKDLVAPSITGEYDLIIVDSFDPYLVLQASSLAARVDWSKGSIKYPQPYSNYLRTVPFFVINDGDFFSLESFLSTYVIAKDKKILILGNSSFFNDAKQIVDSTDVANNDVFLDSAYFSGFPYSLKTRPAFYSRSFSLVISDRSLSSGIKASFIASALGYKLIFSDDPNLSSYFNERLTDVIFVDKNNNLTDVVDSDSRSDFKELTWLDSVFYDSSNHELKFLKDGKDSSSESNFLHVPLVANYYLLTSNHFLEFQDKFYSSLIKVKLSPSGVFYTFFDEDSESSTFSMDHNKKLVIYNPFDVFSCVDVPSFKNWFEKNQDFTSGSFNPSLFCKNSLLAPYLALVRGSMLTDYSSVVSSKFKPEDFSSGIIPSSANIDVKFSNPNLFSDFDSLKPNLISSPMDITESPHSSAYEDIYLTFLGSPNALPFTVDLDSTYSLDSFITEFSNNPSLIRYNKGHLFGLTVSDTSGLIVRSLYDASTTSVGDYYKYDLKGPITFASANNPDFMFSDLAFLQSYPYYFKNNVTAVQFLKTSCDDQLVTYDPLIVLPASSSDPIELDKEFTLVKNLNVEFTFDKSSIKKGSIDVDDFAVKILNLFDSSKLQVSNFKLEVFANTDARGSKNYNEKLSVCRAMTVSNRLKNILSSEPGFDSIFVKDFPPYKRGSSVVFCSPSFDSSVVSSSSETNINGYGNGERVPRKIPLSDVVSKVIKFTDLTFPADNSKRLSVQSEVYNLFNESNLRSEFSSYIVHNDETGLDELELTTDFINNFKCEDKSSTSSYPKPSVADDPSLLKYVDADCPIYEALHTLNRRVEIRFTATYTVPPENNPPELLGLNDSHKTFVPLHFERGCFDSNDFEFLHHHYYYYSGKSKDGVALGLNIPSRSFLPSDVQYPTTYFLDYDRPFVWNTSSEVPPLALVLARFGAKNIFFPTGDTKITSQERYFVDLLTKPYKDGVLYGGDVPVLMHTGNYLRSVPSKDSLTSCTSSSSCSSDFKFFSRDESSTSAPWLLIGDSLSTVVSSKQYAKEPRFRSGDKVDKSNLGDGYGPKILLSYVDADDYAFSSSFKRFSSDLVSPLKGIMDRFSSEEDLDFSLPDRSIPVRAGHKITVTSIVSVPESLSSADIRLLPQLDYFSLDQPCQINPDLRDVDSKESSREISVKSKVKLPSFSVQTSHKQVFKTIPCPWGDQSPSFFGNSGTSSKTVVHGKKYSIGFSIPLPPKTKEAEGSTSCTELSDLNFPRNIADSDLKDFAKTKNLNEKLLLCSVEVEIPESVGHNNFILTDSKWLKDSDGSIKDDFKKYSSLYRSFIGDYRDYLLYLVVYSSEEKEKDVVGRLDTLHLVSVKDKLSTKISSEVSNIAGDRNDDVQSSFDNLITLRSEKSSFVFEDGSLQFTVDTHQLIPSSSNVLFKLSPVDSSGFSQGGSDYSSFMRSASSSYVDLFSARCDELPINSPDQYSVDSVIVNLYVQSKLLVNGGFWLNVSKKRVVSTSRFEHLSIPSFRETFKKNMDPSLIKKYNLDDYSVFSELFALSFYPSVLLIDETEYAKQSAESISVQSLIVSNVLDALDDADSSSNEVVFISSPSCMNMYSDVAYREMTFGFAQSSISPLPLCYTGQYSKPGNSITFVNPLIDIYSNKEDLISSLNLRGFDRYESLS